MSLEYLDALVDERRDLERETREGTATRARERGVGDVVAAAAVVVVVVVVVIVVVVVRRTL